MTACARKRASACFLFELSCANFSMKGFPDTSGVRFWPLIFGDIILFTEPNNSLSQVENVFTLIMVICTSRPRISPHKIFAMS